MVFSPPFSEFELLLDLGGAFLGGAQTRGGVEQGLIEPLALDSKRRDFAFDLASLFVRGVERVLHAAQLQALTGKLRTIRRASPMIVLVIVLRERGIAAQRRRWQAQGANERQAKTPGAVASHAISPASFGSKFFVVPAPR